jgi:hypothetical protein
MINIMAVLLPIAYTINILALIMLITYTQCDAEGAEVCLLVMANYGCSYVALIRFWSSPHHTRHLNPAPNG